MRKGEGGGKREELELRALRVAEAVRPRPRVELKRYQTGYTMQKRDLSSSSKTFTPHKLSRRRSDLGTEPAT